MGDVMSNAMQHIQENAPRKTTEHFRVPPIMIAALARAGKTTALWALFNKLVDSQGFFPVFVSFDKNLGFEQREGESDHDAFLRQVAGSLVPESSKFMSCTRDVLETYLKAAKIPIVLLIDELNALTKSPTRQLAALLREMFLDPENRYLCFTSHWGMQLEEVMGTGTAESHRGRRIVTVARTKDRDEIKKMFGKSPHPLLPVELPLYGELPGLIFAIKRDQYSPRERFRQQTQADEWPEAKRPADCIREFFEQFCRGCDSQRMRPFNRFTYVVYQNEQACLIWPLCYAEAFLRAVELGSMAELIEQTQTSSGLSTPNHGLEWEFTARIGVCMVLHSARFRDLTLGEKLVVGDLPPEIRPTFHVLELPETVKDIKQAQTAIKVFLKSLDLTTSRIIFAYPSYGEFPIFDSLIRFENSGRRGLSYWRGLQMKLSRGLPTKDATKTLPGVLLRGDPPQSKTKPTLRQNWTYPNVGQLEAFLPFSLAPLIPSAWRLSSASKKHKLASGAELKVAKNQKQSKGEKTEDEQNVNADYDDDEGG
jgi:hypothetical protein